MSRELFCNNTTTTLSSAVTTSGQTTFTVTSGLNFPKTGDFRILIGTEICLVTSVVPNSFTPATWTVVRGVEGTTATTYSSGTRVNFIMTAQSLTNIIHDQITSDTAATVGTYQPPRTGDIYIPTDSFYTMMVFDGNSWLFFRNGRRMRPISALDWIVDRVDANFTVTATGGTTVLFDTAPAYSINAIYRNVPSSTPWTMTTAIIPHYLQGTGNYTHVGLALRSSTGQYITYGVGVNNGNPAFRAIRWNSKTSAHGAYFEFGYQPFTWNGTVVWLRIVDNGTNRLLQASSNGINWTTFNTVARTDFFTPSHVGLHISDSNTSYQLGQTVVHFELT